MPSTALLRRRLGLSAEVQAVHITSVAGLSRLDRFSAYILPANRLQEAVINAAADRLIDSFRTVPILSMPVAAPDAWSAARRWRKQPTALSCPQRKTWHAAPWHAGRVIQVQRKAEPTIRGPVRQLCGLLFDEGPLRLGETTAPTDCDAAGLGYGDAIPGIADQIPLFYQELVHRFQDAERMALGAMRQRAVVQTAVADRVSLISGQAKGRNG
jgi:hypothetical protein